MISTVTPIKPIQPANTATIQRTTPASSVPSTRVTFGASGIKADFYQDGRPVQIKVIRDKFLQPAAVIATKFYFTSSETESPQV